MEKQEEKKNTEVKEVSFNAEHFFEQNKKLLIIIIVAIVVIVVLCFGLHKRSTNRNTQANEAVFAAEQLIARGDYQTALDGNTTYAGFKEIADRYGSTKAGQRAKYLAGCCCLNLGQYDEAIQYFKSYKGKDAITSVLAIICEGDAELELGNTEKAIALYNKATTKSDDFITTPTALFKAGMAYLMNDDAAKAKECFETIKKKYPESAEYQTIDKYIETAETMLK